MESKKVLFNKKEYYADIEDIYESSIKKIFLFTDPDLIHLAKNENEEILRIDRNDPNIILDESIGAGYAVHGGGMGGGYGNPRGNGFGQSSSSNGGPNLMYTYTIKPLNQVLQQGPTTQGNKRYIHTGSEIEGKILGRDIKAAGKVLEIGEDEERNIEYYTILNTETGEKVRIDPTSIKLVTHEERPDPYMRDIVGESYYPSFKDFNIIEKNIEFERGLDPKESMDIGMSHIKLSEEELIELIENNFEEIDNHLVFDLKINPKDYIKEFNNYLKQLDSRLKNDKRNFYKIYNEYGPQ